MSDLSRRPRFFVGTLACGEAELPDCIAAVKAQVGVDVAHHVIENLPELEAHNALWDAWEKHKCDNDFFVKIDADTVLTRTTALKQIADVFALRKPKAVQVLLHDYMTDCLIAGLNAYSASLEFKPTANRLFCDRIEFNRDELLLGDAVRYLAPIGLHSPAPHPRQAFHFGLHRALKQQWNLLAKVAMLWREKRDAPRGWALQGARIALGGFRGDFDYGAKDFEAAFSKLEADQERDRLIQGFSRSLPRQAGSFLGKKWLRLKLVPSLIRTE